MNSPPPSDGLLPPSSQPSEPPSSPAMENQEPEARRRERRKAVLTPRKFRRFFTPRTQTSSQSGSSALQPLRDESLNTRSDSTIQQATEAERTLASPASILASSPLNPSTKRKRTSNASRAPQNEAGNSHDQPAEPTTPRAAPRARPTYTSPTQYNVPGDVGTSPPCSRQPFHGPAYLTTGSSQTITPLPLDFGRERTSTPMVTDFFKAKRRRATAAQKSETPQNDTDHADSTSSTIDVPAYQPKSFIKLRHRGMGAQLLLREQGMTSRPGRQTLSFVEHDSYAETSKFFSRSTDWDTCSMEDPAGGPAKMSIPFSVASSNRCYLTAVGDEDGVVRMFDTSSAYGTRAKQKLKHRFQVHDNAIMDLAFSDDDLRLATACGDRNGKIIDTVTSTVAAELNFGHVQAMRRVKFQPGQANGNVLATCDKAGRIQIWDLRLGSSPVDAFTAVDRSSGRKEIRQRNTALAPYNVGIYNTLAWAHTRIVRAKEKGSSVTALQYMGAGREHLLLSAGENDARIKLWDTRYMATRSGTPAVPLSSTTPPATHNWRDYGITSLSLNTDESRLYAVCRDSTVYAYSTAHLMLGMAPQLSKNPPRQRAGEAETGLGPLYGFQHPNLDVRSFYVRGAIRPSTLGHGPELLAVGSSRGCAVLFPTDEAPLHEVWDRASTRRHDPRAAHDNLHTADGTTVPLLASSPSSPVNDPYSPAFRLRRVPRRPAGRRDATGQLPIVCNGTSLAGGHRREVTGVSWARDGKLVTISDDMSVRHWQERPARGLGPTDDVARDARDLRVDGRNSAKAHGAGWARPRQYWDREDDDSPMY